jgi:competence protein ComEC
MALVYLAVCWTLGLAAGRALGWPAWTWAALAAPALAAALWTRRQGGALLPLVCLLAALAGGGRYALARPAVGPGDLACLHGQGVIVEGYVAAEPDLRGTYTRLELAAVRVFTDGEWAAVRGRTVLDVARYAPYEYGDRLRVEGRLEAPPEIDGFDYREYLAARGVDSVLRYPKVALLEGRAGSALLRLIYRAKGVPSSQHRGGAAHPEAGLLAGILRASITPCRMTCWRIFAPWGWCTSSSSRATTWPGVAGRASRGRALAAPLGRLGRQPGRDHPVHPVGGPHAAGARARRSWPA